MKAQPDYEHTTLSEVGSARDRGAERAEGFGMRGKEANVVPTGKYRKNFQQRETAIHGFAGRTILRGKRKQRRIEDLDLCFSLVADRSRAKVVYLLRYLQHLHVLCNVADKARHSRAWAVAVVMIRVN